MNFKITLIGLILISIGCSIKNEPKNHLSIPNKGLEFQLFQRENIEIPSAQGNIICHIDDITRGQVYLIIKENEKIVFQHSIHEKELLSFKFEDYSYSIECIELNNKLIGDDYAYFKISERRKKYIENSVMNESEKITKLIKKVRESGIIFIRNGSEWTSFEAADHLLMKWENAKNEIKTVDQFIQNIASKSSSTGKEYYIKLKDGSIIKAEKWFKQQL